MSRASDPISKLRPEANAIALALKNRDPRMLGQGGQVFRKPDLTFCIAMDDKFLKISTTWEEIDAQSEHHLTEWILTHMRETKQ